MARMERREPFVTFRHGPTDRNYFCEVCKKRAKSVEWMFEHVQTQEHVSRTENLGTAGRFICVVCDRKPFSTLEAMVQHATTASRHRCYSQGPTIASAPRLEGPRPSQDPAQATTEVATAASRNSPSPLNGAHAGESEGRDVQLADADVERLDAKAGEEELLCGLLGPHDGPPFMAPAISQEDVPAVLQSLASVQPSAPVLSQCWAAGYDLETYTFPAILNGMVCDFCKESFENVELAHREGRPVICHHHRGLLRKNSYGILVHACCQGPVGGPGCARNHAHRFPEQHQGELARKLRKTHTPARTGEGKRRAVALYCENFRVYADGQRPRHELLAIHAVDLFTREVLLSALVNPMVDDGETWQHPRESAATLAVARDSGRALANWAEARTELWRLIDADTVLVMFAGGTQLALLGVVHPRVVDVFLLAGPPVDRPAAASRNGGEQGFLDLYVLARQLGAVQFAEGGWLADGRFVRGLPQGVLDALLIREVALWCLRNPEALAQWRAALPAYQTPAPPQLPSQLLAQPPPRVEEEVSLIDL